jgi:hypothetical protein
MLLAAVVVNPLYAQSPSPPVTVSGLVQADYTVASSGATMRDRAYFRRLQFGLHVTPAEDWLGTMQVDVAPSTLGDRVIVRDAYVRYLGWSESGLTFTLGNQKPPFARGSLSSAARRGLIERPATGERLFGSPGRVLGAQIEGRHRDQHLQWAAAVAASYHAPDVFEIRLDGISESRDTWNEGVLSAGRFEWHPRGNTTRDQGDFARGPIRIVIGAGAYTWHNDGDRNTYTVDGINTSNTFADLDHASGLEVSGGLRGGGVTIDAGFHRIDAQTIDPAVTAGVYSNGDARMYVTGLEGGYMLPGGHVELLGGFDVIAITAQPSTMYRPAFGANWYINQHRLKFQFSHRETFNALGASGVRLHATTLQAQLVF